MLGIENSSFFTLFYFIFIYTRILVKNPFTPPAHQKKKKKKNSIYFIMLYGSFVTLK